MSMVVVLFCMLLQGGLSRIPSPPPPSIIRSGDPYLFINVYPLDGQAMSQAQQSIYNTMDENQEVIANQSFCYNNVCNVYITM